jgi:hypothetical protein
MSEKYFGAKNPVGRYLAIRFKNEEQSFENQYHIVGVAEKIPIKSSFGFICLPPFEGQLRLGQADFANSKQSAEATFVTHRSVPTYTRRKPAQLRDDGAFAADAPKRTHHLGSGRFVGKTPVIDIRLDQEIFTENRGSGIVFIQSPPENS